MPIGEAALTVIVVVALSATAAPAAGEVMDTVGVTAVALTVILLAELVVVFPTLSVATAVREYVPGVVGVHVAVNGKTLSVPIETPLAKNCTLATTPVDDEALARTVCVVFTLIVAPLAGETMEPEGATPAETDTAVEVACAPALSVAVAVNENVPEAAGVHEVQ